MRTSWIVFAAALGAASMVLCECAKEGFRGFAEDACDALNKDSAVYQSSPRLQALCDRAGGINPTRTCLVDCDVRELCGDPSVGLCRQPRASPVQCRITADYYGSHPENRDLPDVYRVRRGTCLSAAADGEAIADRRLLLAMLRFPDELAIVGSGLGHASRLQGSWSVTFSNLRGDDGQMGLPLVEPDYAVEATAEARRRGVAARIPTAVLHESCVSPGGRDTSFMTEPVPLQQRLVRARDHENQPPTLHVTARFALPDTASMSVAGIAYRAFVPGQPEQHSPVSGKKLSVRTEVWLMVAVSPKTDAVTELREVLKGSDGVTHITRVRTGAPLRSMSGASGEAFVSYTGEPPALWVGMRDAAGDVTLSS